MACRRVAGGLRRALVGAVALFFLVMGILLLVFPHVMAVVLAAGAFWLSVGFGVYAFGKRRIRERDDGD